MSPADEDRIRVLWEETPRSGSQIAAEHGVTKNVISGVAWRRGWSSFNSPLPPPRTTFERLDAIHSKFDQLWAETEPAIRNSRIEAAKAEAERKA